MEQFKTNNTVKGLIPVMLMAYNENGTIDYNGIERLTDFYLGAGSAGLFTNCYSTEMYNLTPDERIRNARHIVKRVNGKVPIVAVGTFAETTDANVELIKQMYDTGVDTVIMVSGKLVRQDESDEVFLGRLQAIIAGTNSIPLGIYECPVPYKRIVNPLIYNQLLPYNRITYHKDTSCNMDSVREKLDVLRNTSVGFYEAHMPHAVASLKLGASGLSAIAGNFYPEVLSWMCENYNNADKQADVKFMESEFIRVDPLIHEAYPVSAKYFLQLRGIDITMKSRWYTGLLNDTQQQSLKTLLETFYQWCERLSITLDKSRVPIS